MHLILLSKMPSLSRKDLIGLARQKLAHYDLDGLKELFTTYGCNVNNPHSRRELFWHTAMCHPACSGQSSIGHEDTNESLEKNKQFIDYIVSTFELKKEDILIKCTTFEFLLAQSSLEIIKHVYEITKMDADYLKENLKQNDIDAIYKVCRHDNVKSWLGAQGIYPTGI